MTQHIARICWDGKKPRLGLEGPSLNIRLTPYSDKGVAEPDLKRNWARHVFTKQETKLNLLKHKMTASPKIGLESGSMVK